MNNPGKSNNKPFFTLPKILNSNFPRVMSLKNAADKMSKSSEDDNTRINLLDDEIKIIKKIRKAKTDSLGAKIIFNPF